MPRPPDPPDAQRDGSLDTPLDALVADLGRDAPLRVWSFLITLFGDAIVPRGGTVDSATVQAITGRIGIEPGTVRVAFSRLARDGWIERRRSGRGSLYSLSARGRAPFETASRRIYAAPGAARDERPRLLALGPPPGRDDERLAGLVAADAAALELRERVWLLVDGGPAHRAALEAAGCLVTPATVAGPPGWLVERLDLDRLARELDVLGARLARFDDAARGGTALEPLDALLARLLLVHAWRRALLHVPTLPPMLQPPGWPLAATRERAGALYRRLLAPSARWLDAHGRGPHGPLPPDDPSVGGRFVPPSAERVGGRREGPPAGPGDR